MNQRTPEQCRKLEIKRSRSRRQCHRVVNLLIELKTQSPKLEVYWEWPRHCSGWDESLDLTKALAGPRPLMKSPGSTGSQ